MTPFGEIMRRVVETTPGAVGGAFADPQGEMVDSFAKTHSAHDWAVLTAHYGVILAHLHNVFGIWHFGGLQFFVAQHASLGIVVHTVEGGYYALLAVKDSNAIEGVTDRATRAVLSLREAVVALEKEMA
jgi:hypothetical protein